MLTELETTLEGMDLGPLLGLWLQSSVIGLTMQIMGIIIFVLVYGRMIEIYLMTSLAPLPVATLSNRELGGTGQNYLKSLFAVGFKGCSYWSVLRSMRCYPGHRHRRRSDWSDMGNRRLYGSLCFMLFKTGGIAQRIFGRIKRTDFGQFVPRPGKEEMILDKDVILTPEQIAAEERRWLSDAPIAELAEVKGVTVDEAVAADGRNFAGGRCSHRSHGSPD